MTMKRKVLIVVASVFVALLVGFVIIELILPRYRTW